MSKKLALCFVLAAALIAVNCGGGPSSPSEVNIGGTWTGFSTNRATNFTLTFSQTGSSLSGTWADNTGHGGTITGSKNGDSVSITLAGNANSCSLSYTGTVGSSLTTMSGTLVGLNCVVNAGGALTLTKS
jgi:hypothetical protein